MALADDRGVDFGGGVIDLEQKWAVLREKEYDDVQADVQPLLQSLFELEQ